MHTIVENIFHEFARNDKSFQEKETAFEILVRPFAQKFTKQQMRDNWHMGIRLGIELGLHHASLEGQKLELYNNIENPKHKEFLDKFYALAKEYNCAIQYHPQHGMVVESRNFHL